MKKLPQKYVIVELIPNHSNYKIGYIVQLQAIKVNNNKIIDRLDLRVDDSLVENKDLLSMISYDKEMFNYTKDTNYIMKELIKFIDNDKLLIIDNYYTEGYLSEVKNKKENVFDYLDLKISDNVFDELIAKYKLEPSNHLVDLLYEAIVFENSK